MSAGLRRRLLSAAIVLIVFGSAAFATLTIQVMTGTGLAALDPAVAEWFRAKRFAEGTVVMDTLATVFGPVYLPLIIAVVLVAWIFLAKHLWRPLLLASGMAAGVVWVKVVAFLVERPRPPLEHMLMDPDRSFSFPSGHVTGVCDFFLLTTFLLASRRSSPAWAMGGVALSLGMVAGQVVGRLYLGYHWLTDTLASVSISLVVLGAVMLIDTRRTVRVHPSAQSGRNR